MRSAIIAVCALSFVACGGEADRAAKPHGAVTGRLVGQLPTAATQVVFAWSVTSTSPDYVYIHGVGAVDGDRFSVELPASVPAKALEAAGSGVAYLVLVDASAGWADGKTLSGKELEAAALGISEATVLTYRGALGRVSCEGVSTSGLVPASCGGLTVSVSNEPNWPSVN